MTASCHVPGSSVREAAGARTGWDAPDVVGKGCFCHILAPFVNPSLERRSFLPSESFLSWGVLHLSLGSPGWQLAGTTLTKNSTLLPMK